MAHPPKKIVRTHSKEAVGGSRPISPDKETNAASASSTTGFKKASTVFGKSTNVISKPKTVKSAKKRPAVQQDVSLRSAVLADERCDSDADLVPRLGFFPQAEFDELDDDDDELPDEDDMYDFGRTQKANDDGSHSSRMYDDEELDEIMAGMKEDEIRRLPSTKGKTTQSKGKQKAVERDK